MDIRKYFQVEKNTETKKSIFNDSPKKKIIKNGKLEISGVKHTSLDKLPNTLDKLPNTLDKLPNTLEKQHLKGVGRFLQMVPQPTMDKKTALVVSEFIFLTDIQII